jgi:serine protease AprX
MFDPSTSMSTPHVAGHAAVLRQTLVTSGISKPLAARIKAFLTNGADELVRQYIRSEAGSPPNNDSGFGGVHLSNSVVILGQTPNAGYGKGGPLIQGIEDTMTINIPTTADTSKAWATSMVTLVWIDPPGPMLQMALT